MAEFDYEVVDGRKIRVRPQEVVSEIDENGYFVRQPNHFTEGFGEGKNPVEKGRYHLVWAKLCHWSNRASIVRELLGLEDAISVNMVDHAKHEKNLGWEFVYDKDHIDPVLGIQFLSEAYYKADDDYTGRTTVPALIDTKTGKVVNNDYTWLTNYFEVDFKPFHKKGAPDLYPEELRKDIDEMNDWLFDNINNGVYKATFAPMDSWLILRGIKTLGVRMDRAQENALKIAHFLEKQEYVTRVLYPGLESHPGYELMKKQARGFGSILTFEVDSKERAYHILENVKLIQFAESLGGTETLITYPITQTHADLSREELDRNGITDRILRLSVGIEGAEDLIADLEAVLKKIK